MVKNLLNSFCLIFAKYYGRIWPLERNCAHGLHQSAASLCHRALFLGFGLNNSCMCGYILKMGTNLA